MRFTTASQPHLEYRPSGFHWRRRWPQALRAWGPEVSPKKMSLLLSLRSHVLPDAKALAQKLTLLSDIAFASVTERTMAISPDIVERLLDGLSRFLIDVAEAAREVAPVRTPEVAAYELQCSDAAIATVRDAIRLRDRDMARDPLRQVADRLGIPLDETDPDWQRLAYRALRIILDANEENFRRDQGVYSTPTAVFSRALTSQVATRSISQPNSAPSLTQNDAPPAPVYPTAPVAPVPSYPVSAPDPAGGAVAARPIEKEMPKDVAPELSVAPVQEICTTHDTSPGPTILDTAEVYIEKRSQGYRTFKFNEDPNPKGGESWAKNSAANVRSTARLMERILGTKSLDDITHEDLTAAFTLMQRIPRNYQAKTDKRCPQVAADEADEQERRNEEITRARMTKKGESPGKIEITILREKLPRLKAATIYRHMQDFQRVFKFAVRQDEARENMMADHIWESAEVERRMLLEDDTERQTWCGRLGKLFRTPIFQDKLEDAGDPMYWAPLIALHMGFRSEEVLQLHTGDIQVIDEIPCIVLKQGPGQSLKSMAARRTVPIHRNLLELGLMRLVEERRRAGEPRLFPWLERSANKKTFTETFSKRFTRYRKDNECYDPQRDFHSFRTTFNHLLIELECQDSHRKYLMGHVERDVNITNYNPHGFAKKTLQKWVNMIEIDISMIRKPYGDMPLADVTNLADRRVSA
ncbi:tyrosine-type recombinase/integrase [Mameliella sp. CS4]|uniref:tyrosine-type recombinase/integrase n=1 Tax=Mameliella sp. CS4 TaxID=2862329 RepID=UPI001C60505A|nr:tyrosine-type recombinase/integrase [Mameliella sp. CS4]MBW4983488.1 tyrosine-type recombinase/integrase [Mameliella sp. CS4]